VGSRPTGNRGIVTASGSNNLTTSTAGVFYPIPLVDGTVGFRQTLPSHVLNDYTVNWYYNVSDHRFLVPKTDRLNLTSTLRHKLSEKVEAFGEILAYRARSITGREPTAFDAATDHNIYVSANNPYNPFGSRFYEINGMPNADGTPRLAGAPADVQISPSTGVRPRDFKARIVTVDSEALRGVAGLRGKLRGDCEWESAVLYGRNTTHDEEQFAVRESRLRAALTSSNPATAFNPFGYTFKLVPQPGNTANPSLIQVDKPFTNAAAVTDALYDNFAREGRTELASWDGKVSGSLADFSFLGGPIGVAAGAEWRWENYKDWRPAYAGLNPAGAPYNGNPNDPNNAFYGPFENDFIALSPNLNLYSARTIIAAYSEVLVPVVAKRNRLPFVHSLDLSVAGRTERFSDFGSTTKPKYGLSWRPTAWALARASFNGSFRAPNLVQLNPSPLQRAVTGVSDPYRSTVTGLNVDSTATRTVFRQGNVGLEAETARSFTTGIVVSPPAISGLTISATEQLRRDELLLDAATQKALAAGTPVASVNLDSGADSYAGNPQVRRFGVTPDDVSRFATYNAGKPASQQRGVVGGVAAVVTDYVNIAGRDVRGVDFGIEYRFPKMRLGQVAVRGDGSYSMKFEEEAQPGALTEDFVNRDGRPRFRGNVGATWRKDRWTAGLSTVYYGSFVDTGASTTKEVYDVLGQPEYLSAYVDSGGTQRYRLLVSSWVYHNAYLNYAIGRQRGSIFSNVSARLGVNNLTDSDPPLADETFGYRRGAGTNPRGRAFYVQVSKRL
ncbi:MAG: TonB-dependent receptor, partial [Opitutaceae bacterium]